jgi:opacity protein-like surface antigen
MVEDGMSDLLSPKIGTTWTLGGGIGRYFTSTVRGDITYDHRFEADASARWEAPTYIGTRRFGITSDVVLANLYYDLDRGSRFSPYIGVGLGATYNRVTDGRVDGACDCATIAGDSNWHVAGALMAGISFKMLERMHLDAGYRFLYLGETKAASISNNTPAAPAYGPSVEDIHAHELRIGLRYDIR